jgi:hypothetical protein
MATRTGWVPRALDWAVHATMLMTITVAAADMAADCLHTFIAFTNPSLCGSDAVMKLGIPHRSTL